MATFLIITLVSIIVVGLAAFIYIFQKKEEESQELKNIMLSVHGKVVDFKSSPGYISAPDETKKIMDYIATTTALTTVLSPTYNPLKDVQDIMHVKNKITP
jgi:hypothetical protein